VPFSVCERPEEGQRNHRLLFALTHVVPPVWASIIGNTFESRCFSLSVRTL
jgi:hypothetical protein